MATFLTISEVKRAAQEQKEGGRTSARFHAQAETAVEKQTRDGKPYWELTVGDAEAKLTLRAWSDTPAFEFCTEMADALRPSAGSASVSGVFIEIEGEYSLHQTFGIEAKQWSGRLLNDTEIETLLGGPAPLREKQARDLEAIRTLLAELADPRLHALCAAFMEDFGERFRRTAAARTFHHARRGGLVEHVAQMMRAARALADVYPTLNRDLLVAGAFFHDIGKLWENCPPAHGFTMSYDERGELIGHVVMGVEVINALWRKLLTPERAAQWAPLTPPSDTVRNHLLHLIASHHGEMAFGAPVFPKTPEAIALHYIDNLDAKLEMMFDAYRNSTELAPGIIERVRPLPANLVKPLSVFEAD